ncbi:MAG: hypothetical protein M1824_005500 [Vezdaea acicularis]|nr:MAG: hypothetical protein M1824_005500 [Vezdaea acicularis]
MFSRLRSTAISLPQPLYSSEGPFRDCSIANSAELRPDLTNVEDHFRELDLSDPPSARDNPNLSLNYLDSTSKTSHRSPTDYNSDSISDNPWRHQSTYEGPSPPAPTLRRYSQLSYHRSLSQDSTNFMPTFTGENEGRVKVENKNGKLSSWFSGTSDPVSIGMPVREVEILETTKIRSPTSSPNKLQKRSPVEGRSPAASVSRFSFFAAKGPSTPSLPATSDEFINMDIRASLESLPSSNPNTSANDILSNAEALLSRMQAAYKAQAASLRELRAEKEAQDEEMEEVQTRVRHLKLQLQEMAERSTVQEQAMNEMAEELALERQRRRDEEEARKRSIALIKSPPVTYSEEDDNFVARQAARDSGITMASDSGLESEGESSADSVFSRTHGNVSPASTMFSSAASSNSPDGYQVYQHSLNSSPQINGSYHTTQRNLTSRPPPPQRPSTFQKVLRGLSTTSLHEGHDEGETIENENGCSNCCGASPSATWNIVGSLRHENKELKDRVVGLEAAVEGCLNLVSGIQ